MKRAKYVVGAIAACLIAVPVLAANTGVTIQIPAATVVTSLDAASVTLVDAAGLYLETDVEAALASVRTRPVFAAAQADVPIYAACTPATDLQWYYVTDASPDATLAGAIVVCAVGANQWRPLFAPWAHASRHLVGESDAVIADQLETDCADGELLVGETDVNADTGQSVGCLAPSYAAAGATTSSGLTMATARLLGRTTAGSGAIQEITPDGTLSLSAGGIGVVDVTCTGCIGSTEVAGLDAADLTSGTIATARLGSGTADDTTFLRGDGAWATVSGGGGGLGGSTGPTDDLLLCSDGTGGATVQACNATSTIPALLIATGGIESYGKTAGGKAAAHVQIGAGASADGSNATYGSVAIGKGATAGDSSSLGAVAVGALAIASGSTGTAVGAVATAGPGAVAIGVNTASSGVSTVVGNGATASNEGTALGHSAGTTGAHSVAIGQLAVANTGASVALGCLATTVDANQLWIGGGSPCTITNIRLLTAVASPPVTCDATHVNTIYGDTSPALCWCDGSAWVVLGGTSCS